MIEVTKRHYTGTVIGVTVPTGVVRVRRNGKECWTCNSGRSTGAYTIDRQPARGGAETAQAKKLGGFDVNALLSHGATEVIRDAQLIRGTRNEEFWNALRMGRPLPEPGVPFVYEKFLETLRAGGINTKRQGDVISLLPLTDADVDRLGAEPLMSAGGVQSKNLEPVPGGLFDKTITGGLIGKKWSRIDLPEPVPNPIMEEPIRRLLGLTEKGLRDVLAGRAEINGKTGGAAVQEALAAVDIDKEIDKRKADAYRLRGAGRDAAIKSLRFLSAAKKQGLHPANWMITKVPVIPPIFRPVSRMGDILLVPDLNDLYRDVFEISSNLRNLRKELPESELSDEKESLYDAVIAAYGIGEAVSEDGKARRLKGALRQVIGRSAKYGLFQSKVISKNVDVVGRGVITPDPGLDMDSIGLPEDKAWTLYKPFIQRRLVRRGIPGTRAQELIEQRSKEARTALEQEMEVRPIIANRAPTWHKFNLMAFHPHIVQEDVIRVSPLITVGFNADFDGDQMNFHVPVSEKAVREAEAKMLPSRNLFRMSDLRSVQPAPGKEMLLGLYQLTRAPSRKRPVIFNTSEEARAAYKRGEIELNDPIVIRGA